MSITLLSVSIPLYMYPDRSMQVPRQMPKFKRLLKTSQKLSKTRKHHPLQQRITVYPLGHNEVSLLWSSGKFSLTHSPLSIHVFGFLPFVCEELSKEQPTTIPATTKETSASTATKATLSKPTKKQTTKRSRCVDRYFGGRVSYLILLLTAIFLFVSGLALISLNIGLNAGNFSSSQVASLHLVIISKNIADFLRRDSQRQPPQSNKNKVEFDDIRDIRDLPPQAVGNTPPISIPQNPTDYTTYVVLYVVGASLSFIGLILGIIVIVLIVRAKKRLDESSQV